MPGYAEHLIGFFSKFHKFNILQKHNCKMSEKVIDFSQSDQTWYQLLWKLVRLQLLYAIC